MFKTNPVSGRWGREGRAGKLWQTNLHLEGTKPKVSEMGQLMNTLEGQIEGMDYV